LKKRWKRWTEKEVTYLADHIGLLTYEEIATSLHRRVCSVKLKAHKAGMSYFDNFYSCTTLAEELGVSRSAITKWFKQGLLKGRVANWSYSWHKKPFIFLEEDIVRFLREHCCNQRSFLHNGVLIPNRYFRNIVREALKGEKHGLGQSNQAVVKLSHSRGHGHRQKRAGLLATREIQQATGALTGGCRPAGQQG
jgi:transposase